MTIRRLIYRSLGPVDLAPGLAVTVEIKTGQRLLSPLLRYKQESLRER
jgi:hypothetical protein